MVNWASAEVAVVKYLVKSLKLEMTTAVYCLNAFVRQS